MGLTLFYKARLRDMAQLPQLVEEVQEVCKEMDWEVLLFDEVVELDNDAAKEEANAPHGFLPLKGILFTPPECETVTLLFAPDGRVTSPISLSLAEDYPSPDLVWSMFVKTQFAGPDLHIALVKFLKHLEQKYFYEMEVMDEGEYWETGDEQHLRDRFQTYNNLINIVKIALTSEQPPDDPRPEKLAGWIEEVLRRRIQGEN